MERSFRACVTLRLLLSFCTNPPEHVDTREVDAKVYDGWSSDRLAAEAGRIVPEFNRSAEAQASNANTDGIAMLGAFIITMPLVTVLAFTKDRRHEIGKLKGQYNAVQSRSIAAGCLPPLPGPAGSLGTAVNQTG